MQSDCISRGIALAVIKKHCEAVTEGMKSTPIFDTYKMAHDHIADAIKAIPAADVRPVILCENCIYYETAEYENGTKEVCRLFKRQMQTDDFCSYAEKRGKNNG